MGGGGERELRLLACTGKPENGPLSPSPPLPLPTRAAIRCLGHWRGFCLLPLTRVVYCHLQRWQQQQTDLCLPPAADLSSNIPPGLAAVGSSV